MHGKRTDDPPRSSSESQTTDATTAGAADDVVVTEEDIDIGGRELYLRCWGQPVPDEPTILLLAGSGPTTSSWEPWPSTSPPTAITCAPTTG